MRKKDLMLDVSQAEELKMAFRRFDWTNAQIKKLCEGNILGDVLNVINNGAEIVMLPIEIKMDPFLAEMFGDKSLRIIDKRDKKIAKLLEMNVDLHKFPYVPKGWDIVWHRRGKCQPIDFNNFSLFQIQSRHYLDAKRDVLRKKPVNANLLDHLLKFPGIIPESYKWKYIYFFETGYKSDDHKECIRCLYFSEGKWYSGYKSVDSIFDEHDYALIEK